MGRPWMKFYPADWQSDQTLGVCSLAARGLWMEMLAIMHRADQYGLLLVNGQKPSDEQLAALARAPADQVRTLVQELETAGVFSRSRNGTIYSRRMTRDEKRRQDGVKSAETGPITGSRRANQAPDKSGGNLPPPGVSGQPPPHPEARVQKPQTRIDRSIELDSEPCARESDVLLDQLINAAAGNVVNGATGIEIIRPILDLQAMGCDLDRDILPAVRETVPKLGTPLRTWGAQFLRDAVLAKQAARLRGRGQAAGGRKRTHEELLREDPIRAANDEDWAERYAAWQRSKFWHQLWGPPPDYPGCRVPAAVIGKASIT